MLAQFDKYRSIGFQHFQGTLGAAFVARFQGCGIFFGIIVLGIEGDSIAETNVSK